MDGDFSANGVMTRTAKRTYTNRTITGTANQITVTNGDGVSGNPTLSLPSALTLQFALPLMEASRLTDGGSLPQIVNYANVQYGSATVTVGVPFRH